MSICIPALINRNEKRLFKKITQKSVLLSSVKYFLRYFVNLTNVVHPCFINCDRLVVLRLSAPLSDLISAGSENYYPCLNNCIVRHTDQLEAYKSKRDREITLAP